VPPCWNVLQYRRLTVQAISVAVGHSTRARAGAGQAGSDCQSSTDSIGKSGSNLCSFSQLRLKIFDM
jgi:hypothetical protein